MGARYKLRIPKVKATLNFDKKEAKRMTKVAYYRAQAKNQKMEEFIEKEKARLSTPKWETISKLIDFYKQLGENNQSSIAKTLLGIFLKNKKAAQKRSTAINSNLVSIIAKPETLLLAYHAIKGNKGAMTDAGRMTKEEFNKLEDDQKELYMKSLTFPDKISLYDFQLISRLIQKEKYPWGVSLRISIPKPGVRDKKRPLTIPPFMDRIVQKAIDIVLQAIYEPYFDVINRSFGFRANKGTLDAMIALSSTATSGMKTAIEGDIEAAYDTANREELISCLRQLIRDEKFIRLIRSRLNYVFEVKGTGERGMPKEGIPQGGIDSPYLWNIYMHRLDIFIHTNLQKYVDNLNKKVTDNRRIFNKVYNSIRARKNKIKRAVKKVKGELKKLPLNRWAFYVRENREELFRLIKENRLTNHQKNRVSSATTNKKLLRIFYVRYADDWILLTNGGIEVAKTLKEKIAVFIEENLKLKLSEKKTLITDITKKPAKFLGFEIRSNQKGPLRRKSTWDSTKKKFYLNRVPCVLLWMQPDKQRLINRFHMKGLCDKNGFPTGLPWLSTLETQVIIERTNSVIRGLANFYLPIIRNRAKIHRWIYILRYSCLKTLAQKYRCSIKRLFKRFGINMHSKSDQTIQFRVIQTYKNESYYKDWKLLTYRELVRNNNYQRQKRDMLRIFWDKERGLIGEYNLSEGNLPRPSNINFMDSLNWTLVRTQANFNMPCAYCGTFEDVQMHHKKHVRKRAYTLIPDPQKFTQILSLRNRKQIALCRKHHMEFIHGGKYDGPKLIKLAPKTQGFLMEKLSRKGQKGPALAPKSTKLIDNRIIHAESFIKPGKEFFARSLIEKGWNILKGKNKEEYDE